MDAQVVSSIDVIACAMAIETGRGDGWPLHRLLMVRTGAPMGQCIAASRLAIAESLIVMRTPRDVVVTEAGLRLLSELAEA